MFEKNELRQQEAKMELDQQRAHMDDAFSAIFDGLDERREGEVPVDALKGVVPMLVPLYKAAGLDFTEQDINVMIAYMDPDEDGAVSKVDFVRGLTHLARGVRPVSIEELHFDVSVCMNRLHRIEDTLATLLRQGQRHEEELLILQAPKVPSEKELRLIADAVSDRLHAPLGSVDQRVAKLSEVPKAIGSLEQNVRALSAGLSATYAAMRADVSKDCQDLRAWLGTSPPPAQAVDPRILERMALAAENGAGHGLLKLNIMAPDAGTRYVNCVTGADAEAARAVLSEGYALSAAPLVRLEDTAATAPAVGAGHTVKRHEPAQAQIGAQAESVGAQVESVGAQAETV